jgi:hypothetical protein
MDSIDLSDDIVASGSKHSAVFKALNFLIAILSVLCGISELFTRFDYFFQGTMVVLLGGLIGYLEFRIPPKLFTYASSFFSFLGRGGIYILIAVLNLHGSFVRFIIAGVILAIGVLYCVLEFVPGVQPPQNMSGEQGLAVDDGFDDII